MHRLLLVLALSLFASVPSLTAADLTKLKIVVMSPTGKPVERASVVVSFTGRSLVKFGKTVRTSWEMRTTQEGVADIPELPKGKIRVQVIMKGYQTFGEIFDVDEDQRTIEVKLNPPQPQYSVHEAEAAKSEAAK